MAGFLFQKRENSSGKRNWILPVILLCLISIIGISLFVFWDYLQGMWIRHLGTPEELFFYTQQKQLQKLAKDTAKGYEILFYPEETADFGYSCDLSLAVSEGVLPPLLLPDGSTVSSDFLSDIQISLTGGNYDRLRRDQVGIALSGQHILSVDVIGDTYSGQQWLAFPELQKQYIHFAPRAETGGAPVLSTAEIKQWMPTAEDVETFLIRYGMTALSHIHSVTKSEETVSVAQMSCTFLVLTAQMTESELLEMNISLLRQLREDLQIKDIIAQYGKYYNDSLAASTENFTPIDVYAIFQADIDKQISLLDQQRQSEALDRMVVIRLLLDENNHIAGQEIIGPDSQVLFSCVAISQQEHFALQMQFPTMALSGTGTMVQGVINGDFTLTGENRTPICAQLTDCSWSLLPKGSLS